MDSRFAAELVIGPATSGRTRWRQSEMTDGKANPARGAIRARGLPRHCEEQARRSNPTRQCQDWIASRSLSSGRPLRVGPVGSQQRRTKRRKGSGTPTSARSCLSASWQTGRRALRDPSADAARARRSALACRRSTTVLAKACFRLFRSASSQASWDAAGAHDRSKPAQKGAKILRFYAGVTRARLSQSRESTSRAGLGAGERDARSCPGAECIVPRARGHRTRSAFRSTLAKGVLR